MKRCPTCLEEFADKFGFCPVDGTQLNGHVAGHAADAQLTGESVTFASASAHGPETAGATDGFPDGVGEETVVSQAAAPGAGGREEYHLTMLDDVGLTRRLGTALREVSQDNELNWQEFKRSPGGFTKRAVTGYSRAGWSFFSQRNIALATFTAFFAIAFLASVVYVSENPCRFANLFGMPCTPTASTNPYENLELVGMVPDTEIPKEQEKPDKGPAGTNKGQGGGSKPKYEKPAGGGGGGRENPLPTSFGKPAPGSMQDQIIPPSVRPPIPNPKLPVAATIKGDPLLLPPDMRPIAFGDPKSTSTTPSDGPGRGGGQGTGEGTGQGPGQGAGYGPGRGENVGGGDPNYGGGGRGGGGGGDVDYSRPFQMREVTTKAVIISKPEAGFTEEARRNNVTGLVRLRAILSSGGAVQSISVVKGLPDGLTEKAIAAARNIKFRPAQKDGRAVSQWITLEYNFNIY